MDFYYEYTVMFVVFTTTCFLNQRIDNMKCCNYIEFICRLHIDC